MPPSRAPLQQFVPAGHFLYPLPPWGHAKRPGLGARAAPLGTLAEQWSRPGRPRPSWLPGGRLGRGRVPVACLRAASCPAGVRALWRQPTLAAEMMRIWRRAAPAPRHSLSARLRAVRSGCAPRERGVENGAAGGRVAAAPGAKASAAAAPAAGRPPAAQWSGGGGRAMPGTAAVGRAHRVLRAWLGPQHTGRCLLRRPQPAPPRPGGEEGAHPLQEVGGGGICGGGGRGGEGRHRARRLLPGGVGWCEAGKGRVSLGPRVAGGTSPAWVGGVRGQRRRGIGVLGAAGTRKPVTNMLWFYISCTCMCVYIERFKVNSVTFLPSEIPSLPAVLLLKLELESNAKRWGIMKNILKHVNNVMRQGRRF